jgi:hypothetical protein
VEFLLAVGCERFGAGFLGQPAGAVTSLAFVVAGLAVLLPGRGGRRWSYAGLVAAVGIGSLVQHGPHPAWQAYAHDLSLASLLGFVAADAAADLTGRRGLRHAWLPVPVLMVPAVTAGPLASTLVQGLLAAVAIGLNLLRVPWPGAKRTAGPERRPRPWHTWHRPRLRRSLLPALAVLAAGALAGSLTDRTDLCRPESLLQGHALWHLLAAAALWWLAPAVGSGANAPVGVRRAVPEPESS